MNAGYIAPIKYNVIHLLSKKVYDEDLLSQNIRRRDIRNGMISLLFVEISYLYGIIKLKS